MEVETLAFLTVVSIKQFGIQVKQEQMSTLGSTHSFTKLMYFLEDVLWNNSSWRLILHNSDTSAL